MAVDIPEYVRLDSPDDGTLEFLKIQLTRCRDSDDATEYQRLITQTEQKLQERHLKLRKKNNVP